MFKSDTVKQSARLSTVTSVARTVVLLALLVLSAAAAVATSPAAADTAVERDFVGLWRNADPHAHAVTRLDIRPDRNGLVFVRAWRRCAIGECEFGRAPGRIFYSRNAHSRDIDQAAIQVRFGRDDLSGSVLIRLNRRGDIVVHALLSSPSAGDTYATERFERIAPAYGQLWHAPRY